MAKRTRTPQAPPAAAGRRKNARETVEEASCVGSSQPPRSRPKKGARRGGPKEPVDPDVVEGPYMVEFEVIPDPARRIRWGHVDRSGRSAALAPLRERSITGSGLSFALDLPVHRPHIPACLEFIQSAVTIRQERETRDRLDLPMEGTVRGRTMRLDAALVREAFVLPAASLEIKRQVRHSLISDWFAEYQGSGKRYIARTCRRRDWRAALECISMMLLASRRQCTIPGRLTYYIKNFDLDPEDEPEKRLDFADFMVQSLRREVFAVQAHLKADKPERYLETFVAIPLATAVGVEAAPKKGLDVLICSGKSLVVRPGDCVVGFLEGLQKRRQIIIWSRLWYKPLMSYLEALVMRRYLPEFLLDPQGCTVWGGDRAEAVVPRNNLDKHVKLKGFRRLHYHGICTRDVLLVDTAPESFALGCIPEQWIAFLRVTCCSVVDEVYSVAHDLDGERSTDRRLHACPSTKYGWHFRAHSGVARRVIEEAQAEEAPPVEEVAATRVEGTPIEEAPPVEEVAATRVEGAPVEESTRVE
ncbi:hypothetical protein R1sor_005498 [Riccia sorocarpa]|uniref:Uncharacterized protein n=1 Tax=Riccia sorocarpa TaxID=122646 RepID=A0ABD3HK11_9MARC